MVEDHQLLQQTQLVLEAEVLVLLEDLEIEQTLLLLDQEKQDLVE